GQVASNARSIEASTMGSAQLGGVSRERMSSSLASGGNLALSVRRVPVIVMRVMAKCFAFAKAVASQENAAVVLGLAAGRIDQALPGNKIDPDSETPVQVRQVYGVAGWSLSRTASAICVGFRPAENAKWGALA